MDETNRDTHPSYGMLEFSRVTSNMPVALFGSSIKHHNTIRLKIHTAINDRHLNKNWYHSDECLIEIEMSPVQFSEAITAMNTSGTPVTLKFFNGRIEECPDTSVRELFQAEFKSSISKIATSLIELNKVSKTMQGQTGGLKVSEKKELCSKIQRVYTDLIANLPFVQEQFDEQMSHSVNEAKGEIDAFMTNMITRFGLEALKDKLKKPEITEK